jgi:acetyl esterase/lipase
MKAQLKSQLDVSYGPNPRHKLDIYPGGSLTTVVVFWHGGSWKGSDKRIYRFVGRSLARMGYTTILPNYRLHPEVVFPGFIEDGALAVKWLQDTHAPKNIILMGHSAGAFNAAILAFDHSYLKAQAVNLATIKGFIGLSGPYAFNPRSDLKAIFERTPKTRWQPIDLAGKAATPSLLMQGRLDYVVSSTNAPALARKLQQTGNQVRLVMYPLFDHFAILVPFFRGLGWVTSVKKEIRRFLDQATS